ncbi:hypothetical protein [Nodosilinea nodulosa]|uniref:hypothetical protein n=1 Tax=Nodosilinea nodulosa TaxID=416001 RepID=UPI000368D658|nr:hypothetical protein [Nodosilinea nodulosa]
MYGLAKFNKTKSCLILILGIFLVATICLANTLNIWFDEAYTLDTTSGTLRRAFSQAIIFEEQAPLYFIFIFLWQKIIGGIFFARLFSILSIGAAIYLSADLSKRYLPGVNPLILPLLIAVNPFSIWAALEIRLYAFSIFLSTVLLWLFYDGYLQDEDRYLKAQRYRWLFILVACISLYTHYFLGSILVANGLILLIFRQTKAWQDYLSHAVLILIISLPIVGMIIYQLSNLSDNIARSTASDQPTILTYLIKGLQKSFGSFFLHGLPALTPQTWAGIRLALFVVLLCSVLLNYRLIRPQISLIWLMMIAMLIQFSVVFAVIEDLHYRHASPMFIVSLMTMIGMCVAGSRYRWPMIKAYVLVNLTLSLICIGILYTPLAKPGDYRRVADYLMAHESKSQPILVYNQEVSMALSYYYTGQNILLPLPKPIDYRSFNINDFLLTSPDQIDVVLSSAQQNATAEIWLVADNKVLKGQEVFEPSFKILNTYIGDHYKVIDHKLFYGTKLLKLTKKDANIDSVIYSR